MQECISKYRVMWVWVLFDLPTETKKQRKMAAEFRKSLIQNGFQMFQFSIYMRHCASVENAEVHKRRVRAILPAEGKVCIMGLTDAQFANMQIFYGAKSYKSPPPPMQLELF